MKIKLLATLLVGGVSLAMAGPATAQQPIFHETPQRANHQRVGVDDYEVIAVREVPTRDRKEPVDLVITAESPSLLGQAMGRLAEAQTEKEQRAAETAVLKILSEQFDADMEKRQAELEPLRKQLHQLEQAVEKRLANKDKILQLRLQILIAEAEGLGWSESVRPQKSPTRQDLGYGPNSFHRWGDHIGRSTTKPGNAP